MAFKNWKRNKKFGGCFSKSHQIWEGSFLQSKPRITVRRKQRFSENTDTHVHKRNVTCDKKRDHGNPQEVLKFFFPTLSSCSPRAHTGISFSGRAFWLLGGISKSTTTLYEECSHLSPLNGASVQICDLMLGWSRVNTWHLLHEPVMFPKTHLQSNFQKFNSYHPQLPNKIASELFGRSATPAHN